MQSASKQEPALWQKDMSYCKTVHDVCSYRLRSSPTPPSVSSAIEIDPAARMESSEQSAILNRAVAALPEIERITLKMVHLEGMTEDDVGHCMAMPTAKVRRALARAREMLKARLA